MGSSPPPRFCVAGLDEIEAIPIPGALNWRPVRGALGVRAFGVASFHAPAAGDELIEAHTEVLAFGGEPVFRPSGSEFVWRVRALLPDRPDEAQAIVYEAKADGLT